MVSANTDKVLRRAKGFAGRDGYRAVRREWSAPRTGDVGAGVRGFVVVKTFDALFAELTERARTRPAESGTVRALDDGVHAQGKKVLEEAGEVWIAAEHESNDRLAEEVSQLLYRIQVLMIGRGLGLQEVYRYL